MDSRKKRKTIEIGDHVKETVATKGSKKRCGEVLLILQDDPGDPTCELVEVDPDDLSPIEKGSDGVKLFKTKRSRLKQYTPIKKLFTKIIWNYHIYLDNITSSPRAFFLLW